MKKIDNHRLEISTTRNVKSRKQLFEEKFSNPLLEESLYSTSRSLICIPAECNKNIFNLKLYVCKSLLVVKTNVT